MIARLAEAARKTKFVHSIMLMVEMGDMRDGIMPENVEAIARQVTAMPDVTVRGIGANFACLSGTAPTTSKMNDLSAIASHIEQTYGILIPVISGGNSANFPLALGQHSGGRINNLRLGEVILLGVEPVSGEKINGLFTDAFTLITEVIEAKSKPVLTKALFTDPALQALRLVPDNNHAMRSILAIGKQDTDIAGLTLPKAHCSRWSIAPSVVKQVSISQKAKTLLVHFGSRRPFISTQHFYKLCRRVSSLLAWPKSLNTACWPTLNFSTI